VSLSHPFATVTVTVTVGVTVTICYALMSLYRSVGCACVGFWLVGLVTDS
jgi:hypothetical protein